MGSFIQTVADVAGEMGSTEIIRLVRAAMQLHPSKRSVEQLTEKVLLAATSGQSGLEVAEYPKYRLKRSLEAANLPTRSLARLARSALVALEGNNGGLSLPVIAQHYARQTKSVARCPEYWMYRALEEQLAGVVSKTGELRIRLTQGKQPRPQLRLKNSQLDRASTRRAWRHYLRIVPIFSKTA